MIWINRWNWSPDGSRLLFQAYTYDPEITTVIYQTDRAGSPAEPLVEGNSPRWVDGSSRILFFQPLNGTSGLYLTTPQGDAPALFAANAYQPVVAPTGDKDLYLSEYSTNLYRTNLQYMNSTDVFAFERCDMDTVNWNQNGELFTCRPDTTSITTTIAGASATAPGMLHILTDTRGTQFLPLSRNVLDINTYRWDDSPGYPMLVFNGAHMFRISDGSSVPLQFPDGEPHEVIEWRYMP
jgi:hypothetical protein